MRIPVNRKNVKVMPDTKRVIARFFYNGEERAKEILRHIEKLSDQEVQEIIFPLLQEFSKRHRNITKIFYKNSKKLYRTLGYDLTELNEIASHRRLLIGSYFTHEYSIESAAFFNPSIIDDPDQSDLEQGQRRLIISFRA